MPKYALYLYMPGVSSNVDDIFLIWMIYQVKCETRFDAQGQWIDQTTQLSLFVSLFLTSEYSNSFYKIII